MKQHYLKGIILCLCLFTGINTFAYDAEINGIYYHIYLGEATVTYKDNSYNSYSGNVVIPASVRYNNMNFRVTSIGSDAFHDCNGLTSITIPNSVTSIRTSAFQGCSGLTSITIPESVTSIDQGVFYGCTSLTSIEVEGGNPRYDSRDNCNAIIETSTNTLKIGCKSTSIPNSVTSIGGYAFIGCSSLTSITIPNNVTIIYGYAFSYCSSLTSVTIGNSVTDIDNCAFQYCTSLTSVTIGNSVTSIGFDAFSNCSSLTSITIPNSVTNIGGGAFSGCTSLTSVTIPDGVTSIGRNAFEGTPWYNNQPDGVVYAGKVAIGYKGIMPEGTSIVIVDGTEIISDAAFSSCTGLTSITLPKSVTSIDYNAFSGCSGLTSITIGSGVTRIRNYAFSGCNNLTSVHITDLAAWCNISFSDYNSNPLLYAHHLYLNDQEIRDLVIPEGVTSIGGYAFCGYMGLTSVTIGSRVTSIGSSAFGYCRSLTSVIIPNSVTSIGNDAFYDCSGLTSVTIPNSVTSIGSGAFYRCSGLTSVTIGNSVTGIGNTAFQYCTSLTSVTIGNSVTSIGDYAFFGCSSLTSITIPNSVTNIGGGAFNSCASLTSVIIGNGVTSIGDNAFSNCTGLTSVTMPNKATNISEKAFDNDAPLYVHRGALTLLYLWRHSDKKYSIHEIETNNDISTWYSFTASSVRVYNFEPVSGYTKTEESLKVNDVIITGNVAKGLNPGVSFSYWKISLQGEDGNTYTYKLYPDSKNKSIPNLKLTTQQPKVISAGNVIVAAESNLDDEETNVGFEWRRTDWTDEFTSNTGTAYLYEGTMEGYIRNLYTEKLWKYRPYYESDSGNRYYGEWVGIDPTNTNYFEPTVHTYAQINVTGNRAEVKGYVMRGTDRVTSQGFMYWKNTSSYSLRKKAAYVPAGATTVEATGNVMNAVFEDLDYETEYCYVAFVKTEENEMFYGEVQTFSTSVDPDGIDDVKAAEKAIEVARYDLNGRKLAAPQKGINIIRYSDGTSRKVLVK